jgi:hypothetical protein
MRMFSRPTRKPLASVNSPAYAPADVASIIARRIESAVDRDRSGAVLEVQEDALPIAPDINAQDAERAPDRASGRLR